MGIFKKIDQWEAKKQNEAFTEFLTAGEYVVSHIDAQAGNFFKDSKMVLRSFLVATDSRIVYYEKTVSTKVLSYPYSQIATIGFKDGRIERAILIDSTGEVIRFTSSERSNTVRDFVAKANQRVALGPSGATVNPLPPPPTRSSAGDELQKMAELHASGVLSDEEFAAAKKRLIDKI